MSDTKVRDAIRDTLHRNWGILRASVDAAPSDVLVIAMLDACANNLAMTLPELMQDRTVRSIDSVIYHARREWHQVGNDSVEWSKHLAEIAYAEGAKAERLTLSKEWELDRVADDVREACAVLCEDVGREVKMRLTPEGQAVIDGTDRCAARIRETPIAPGKT